MVKDTSKWVNSLGFGSLLTLMCVVTMVALTQTDRNIHQMAKLVESSNARIIAANTMRDIIRQRSQLTIQMRHSRDFFVRDELKMKMSALIISYIDARMQLKQAITNDDEQHYIDFIHTKAEEAYSATEKLHELLANELDSNAIATQFLEVMSLRNELLEALNNLVRLEEQISSSALYKNLESTENVHDVVISFSGFALIIGLLVSVYVVKESSRQNTQILYKASHDELTQLVNRKEFENILTRALSTAQRDDAAHVLCYLDLDHFKIINDTCGHAAGDKLLIQLSSQLKKHIRSQDTLARLGGDEFGLLLENCPLEKAIEIAEGLVGVIKNHAFEWNDRIFHVGVSIGLIPVTRTSESITNLMSEADMSCYAAKDMGRNRVHVHQLDGEHVKQLQNEMHWVANIRTSISENRFMLYVQPIQPLSLTKNKQHKYEILLRMRDDQGNIISPGRYIPAAERFGLMRDVDYWVIEETFKYLEHLSSEINELNIRLFINLSANSLSDTEIREMIIQKVQHSSVQGSSICFEITETSAIRDIDLTVDFMRQLQAADCRFALDDFGSGMSSFTYLKNLPVNYLKLEGTIVNQMATNKIDHAMIAAMNEVGKIMNIKTIAEHVENEEILEKLETIGISYAQGYHFSSPFPIVQLESLLKKDSNSAA